MVQEEADSSLNQSLPELDLLRPPSLQPQDTMHHSLPDTSSGQGQPLERGPLRDSVPKTTMSRKFSLEHQVETEWKRHEHVISDWKQILANGRAKQQQQQGATRLRNGEVSPLSPPLRTKPLISPEALRIQEELYAETTRNIQSWENERIKETLGHSQRILRDLTGEKS